MQKVYADESLGIRRSEVFARPLNAVTYDCPDSQEAQTTTTTKKKNDIDEFFD